MKYTLAACLLCLCFPLLIQAQDESILPGKTRQEAAAIADANNKAAAANSTTTTRRSSAGGGVFFLYPGYPGLLSSKEKKDAWRAERDAHRTNRQRRKDRKADARLNGTSFPGGYRGMKDGKILSPEEQAMLPAGEGIRERYKLSKKQ